MEEIRKIRDEQAARFNYDPDAIFEHFKRREKERGWPLVTLQPRRAPKSPKPVARHKRPGGRAA
jgi:hypothetical protein